MATTENIDMDPADGSEIVFSKRDHEGGENGHTAKTKRQRQRRTLFSSLQQHELEKAFSHSHTLTPESACFLQKIGIPRRTLKVWFKNRRAKWRKEMRKGFSLEKKPTAGFQYNNVFQPDISPNCRSFLTPAANLHNNAQNTRGSATMLGHITLSHSFFGNELWGDNGGFMSGTASSATNGKTLVPDADVFFPQSDLHLPVLAKADVSYNGSRYSPDVHSGPLWINPVPGDPRHDLHPILEDDQKEPKQSGVSETCLLSSGPRPSSTVHSKTVWIGSLSNPRCDLHLLPEGDREVPKQSGVPQPFRLSSGPSQSSSAHSNAAWIYAFSDSGLRCGLHLIPEGDRKVPNQSSSRQMQFSTVQSNLHLNAPWIETLPALRHDVHLMRGYHKVPMHFGVQQIPGDDLLHPATGHISEVNLKVEGSPPQMTLQDLELESRLNDLMEIIAEDELAAQNNTEAPAIHTVQPNGVFYPQAANVATHIKIESCD